MKPSVALVEAFKLEMIVLSLVIRWSGGQVQRRGSAKQRRFWNSLLWSPQVRQPTCKSTHTSVLKHLLFYWHSGPNDYLNTCFCSQGGHEAHYEAEFEMHIYGKWEFLLKLSLLTTHSTHWPFGIQNRLTVGPRCFTINLSSRCLHSYKVCEWGEANVSPRGGTDAESQSNRTKIQLSRGAVGLVRTSQWAHFDPGKATTMLGPVRLFGHQIRHYVWEKGTGRLLLDSNTRFHRKSLCVDKKKTKKQLCFDGISIT